MAKFSTLNEISSQATSPSLPETKYVKENELFSTIIQIHFWTPFFQYFCIYHMNDKSRNRTKDEIFAAFIGSKVSMIDIANPVVILERKLGIKD